MKRSPQILVTYLFLSLVTIFNCKAQTKGWTYKNVPDNYAQSTGDNSAFNNDKQAVSGNAYDLTASLPAGYVKDGSVDYSKYLQIGINNNRVITFPDFPVMVNTKGLSVPSETTIIFKSHSKLVLQPNALPTYRILNIQNVKNVVLYSPVIEGDRENHSGTTGQWGMGISIKGSKNVKLINPKVSKCWGDGIYIGSASGIPCENIVVRNAFLDNNRRNGISIVSGRNVQVVNSVIANTNGQNPMAGIDIEPNTNKDVLEHIVIQKLTSFNNAAFGIMVSPGSMKGPDLKNIDVLIDKHTDDGSGTAFAMSLERTSKPIDGQALLGNIRVIAPVWKNNSSGGFKRFASPGNRIKVSIQRPFILKNINGRETEDKQGKMLMQKNVADDKNFSVQ